MALSSINFQKTKSNSVAETTREFEAKYLLKKEDRQNNEYWNCGKSDSEVFEEELSKANRKGGRVPKLKNSIWEAVVNLNAKQDMKDLKKLAKHIEKKFNITCTRIAIHRDEGHYDENGKVQYNYHAHMNFVTYKDGKQNWRREYINKKVLSELQTETAKILDMDRGEVDSKAVRANHRQFRANADKIKEERKLLAKQQDLKEEIARLRAELKQNGAVRSDYAQLEQLNKDLKQQIKDKTLTISDLQDKIKGLETQLLEEKKEKEHFKSLVEDKEIEIVELENQNKSLQEQKNTLEEQILELGKKINSSPIMKEYEHKIKEYEKQIEDYDHTFTKLDEILLTDEEKKQDKYLTTSETVQRVSRVKKENTWFKARFKELNELLKAPIKFNIEDLLKEPIKIYTDIFKAVSDKIRFGVEDTKKFFDNLKETSKEINKQLSSSSNPGTKKNEDLDTPNSSNLFKRKFKRNRDN